MRQLDLFGFTEEKSAPAIKEQVEEAPVSTATKTEKAEEKVKAEEPKAQEEEPFVAGFVQTSILDAVAAEEPQPVPAAAPQDNVVFSDNNIKVKIKVKAVKQAPVATPSETAEAAIPVTEEPVADTLPEVITTPPPVETEIEAVPEVVAQADTEENIVVAETEEAITEVIEEEVIEESVAISEPEMEEPALEEITAPLQEKEPAEVTAAVHTEEPVTKAIQEAAPEKTEEPVIAPKKTTTVIKPEENKILAPVTPKPAARKTPPPAPSKKRGRKSFKEIDAEVDLVNVPDDDALFLKQYYPISTVATWFNVNTSLLRYWENEFDILKPRKNRKGDRLFRPEDVKSLQTIYYLLRQRKFTIEGAKEYLKSNKRKVDLNAQLVQSLTRFRSFLLELKANL